MNTIAFILFAIGAHRVATEASDEVISAAFIILSLGFACAAFVNLFYPIIP